MGSIAKISTRKFTWIDINQPNRKDLEFLRTKFKFLENDIIASLPSTHAQRPRASFRNGYSFMAVLFPIFKSETKRIEPAEVDVFITNDHLITVHDRKVKDISEYFSQLEKDNKLLQDHFEDRPSYFFYELLARLYHSIFPMLDHINQDIKKIENNIFIHADTNTIKSILEIKSNILSCKHIMHSHKSMLKKMLTTEIAFFSEKKEINLYFNELLDHVRDIWGILETYEKSIESLENTSNALVDQKTNNIIKTLTLLTLLVFPLTIFSGIFGMNAQHAPIVGLPNDFWIILSFMAVTTLINYTLFKWKRWI